VKETLRIGRQIAEGLAAAHATDLIHRDIKPANILIESGPQRRVKITDFGLARAADDASISQSGIIAGTPMYMAPEQAKGEKIDQRADLFSFGSVLYQMVAGRPPFRANSTLAVLKRVAEDTPRPIREIIPETPQWLCDIIAKLHAKNPDERYQSAREIADVLANCDEQLKASGKVKDLSRIPQRALPKVGFGKRVIVSSFIVLCLVALVAVVASVYFNKPESKPKDEPIAEVPAVPRPPLAIAPFDAAQAKKHQDEWAKYLGVQVEFTNSIGMKFRLIPPGELMMGSTPEEIATALKEAGEAKLWQERIKSGALKHKVILTQPFFLGANEVTQAEYQKVMGTNPSHFSTKGAGKESVAGLQTDEHPVESVSWNDAAEFCAKLSKQEKLKPFYFRAGETITPLDGTGYRLPSEAEWEFVCRAGTTTKYWIGDMDEDLVRAGWFIGNSGNRTHAVGELNANPFGLFDIHGNVWEWVQDGWDASFYGQFSEITAINPIRRFSTTSWRVIRGGSWHDIASFCRSSNRHAHDPTVRYQDFGFRVSLPVDAVKTLLVARTQAFANPKSETSKPAAPPFTDADVKRMPDGQQVEEVRKALKQLNPKFDG
jgi:formylglycine-generating enzyme required for sulfatase activity